jgi:nucleoside-diphosphate-sugar epimerase
MSKMRIFLTGASGYLGSLLAERLAELPEVEAITGIGLTPPRGAFPAKMNFLKMDMRSPELAKVMAGHDVVIHTACIVLWPHSMPVAERDDINLNGVRNVAKAALANGVKRFIHTSSMAAYDPIKARGQSDVKEDFPRGGNSPYYYWNGKAEQEHALEEILGTSGMLMTFLRPIYIIGPRNQAVVESYRQNAVNFLGRNPRRQFIHEEDVASAFLMALRKDLPGAYNVAADDTLHLSDVWRIVGKKFVPTVPLGLAKLITAAKWRFMGSPVHLSWVEDMLVDFTGSNAKLKAAGWQPRFNSEAALKSAVLK